MDFSAVKEIVIPEGSVKKIEIGSTVLWSKPQSLVWAYIQDTSPTFSTDEVYAIAFDVSGNWYFLESQGLGPTKLFNKKSIVTSEGTKYGFYPADINENYYSWIPKSNTVTGSNVAFQANRTDVTRWMNAPSWLGSSGTKTLFVASKMGVYYDTSAGNYIWLTSSRTYPLLMAILSTGNNYKSSSTATSGTTIVKFKKQLVTVVG